MKKIGIFGGSFNPIHAGHLNSADYLLSHGLDEIRFLLNPCSPFKSRMKMPDAYHRAKMIQYALMDYEYNYSCNDWHLDTTEMMASVYNHTCYTVNTLKEILYKDVANHLTNEYYLILGIDVFNNIKKFKNWRWFVDEKLVKFIILPRGGCVIDETLENEFNDLIYKIDFSEYSPIVLSSTEIRNSIKEGDEHSMSLNIPDSVCKYIKINKLYDYPLETVDTDILQKDLNNLTENDTVKDLTCLQKITQDNDEPKTFTVDECKKMLESCPYEMVKNVFDGFVVVKSRYADKTIAYNIYDLINKTTVIDSWFVDYSGEICTLGYADKQKKIKKFTWNYKQFDISSFIRTNTRYYCAIATRDVITNRKGYKFNVKNVVLFDNAGGHLVFNNGRINDASMPYSPYIVRILDNCIKDVLFIEDADGKKYQYDMNKNTLINQ